MKHNLTLAWLALLVAPVTAVAQPARAPIDTTWRRGGVCYEIFVRSFYDSDGDGIGDFAGLTQKLDYVNDGDPRSTRSLGAKCIWLMPIQSSPSYHGYDVKNYYHVNPEYGTAAESFAVADDPAVIPRDLLDGDRTLAHPPATTRALDRRVWKRS